MSVPPIASVLIGSPQVDVMKDWYRTAFTVRENEAGAFEFGPIQLFIETHSEIHGPTMEPARCIINLTVDDCLAVAADLKSKGVRFVRDVESAPFGLIGTIADPDGNLLQIIQWGMPPEAHVR